uniref:Variant surface glycoprotein 1125.4305 n=1 Tax=Trypanosoma brucei TaxID=5691 RepID=A0A1J0RA82_9TRYP|nr:variant surface glycoprotein 1125.4305 [Trypanosoma brucei]
MPFIPQLALILCFIVVKQYGVCDGDNAKEFKDMCLLLNLATQKVPIPQLKSGASDSQTYVKTKQIQIMKSILRLNVTVIEPQKEAVLKDVKTYPTINEINAKDAVKGYFEGITDDKLKELRAEYAAGTLGEGKDETFVKDFSLPFSEITKAAIRKAIARQYTAAVSVDKDISEQSTAIHNAREAARRHLKKAVFGSQETALADAAADDVNSDFGDVKAAGKLTFVGGSCDSGCNPNSAAAKTAGDGLALDLVCLCSGGDGAGTSAAKFCTKTALNGLEAITTNDDGTIKTANYKALIEKCRQQKEAAPLALTPATLAAAARSLTGHLGSNWRAGTAAAASTGRAEKQNHYLGVHVYNAGTTATCNAETNNPHSTDTKGVCINYEHRFHSDEGISWMKEINAAMGELQTIESALSQQTAFISTLKELKAQMENILLEAPLLADTQTPTPNAARSPKPVEEQNKCKLKNATAEECPETDCNYDTKKQECKPKPGTEAPAAGTGGKSTG